MKNGICIFLLWLLLGACGDSILRKDEVITRASDAAYLCEAYTIDTESDYAYGAPIEYQLRIIQLKGDVTEEAVDFSSVNAYINKELNPYNFYYNIGATKTEVHSQLINKRIRYRDLLQQYWAAGGYGFITVIVLPDYVDLVEGSTVGGAALGVPRKHNTSVGKPIFFVREKFVNTGVMIHELLHTKGALHTFTAAEYLDNEPSCDTGDMVHDTPVPEPDYGIGNTDCHYYPGDKDRLTKAEQDIIRFNWLSYAPPKCMKTLEIGQVERIRYIASRHSLLQAAENRVSHLDVYVSPE